MNEHILAMPHVAFKTNRYPQMVTFYRDILGFQPLFTLYHTQTSLERTGQTAVRKPGDEWIQYFKIAPNRFIELFDEPFDKQDSAGDYSYHCLTLAVENLEGAERELAQKGLPIFAKTEKHFFVRDPEGNWIEFTE